MESRRLKRVDKNLDAKRPLQNARQPIFAGSKPRAGSAACRRCDYDSANAGKQMDVLVTVDEAWRAANGSLEEIELGIDFSFDGAGRKASCESHSGEQTGARQAAVGSEVGTVDNRLLVSQNKMKAEFDARREIAEQCGIQAPAR